MGIVRNAVKCGGCKATIVLRVGVGLDKEQPFYFVCANCNAASRGKMMLYDQGSVRIELEGSELIPEVVGQYQVVTLHPDLPSITSVDTLDGFGSSPFLMQRQLLGERFSEFYERLGRFRGVVDQDWVAFRRWFGYYLDNRSAQFDLEGERLLGETWKILKQKLL